MQNGGKRAVLVWHRRAGKDLNAFNWTITAMTQRKGLYWHVAPTYKQGRRIVWDGITSDENKFLDFIPKELIAKKRDDQMKIELINGSIWQVVGTDDVDSLVGANPVGIVMSEYSLQNPKAWELLNPILNENGGWVVFAYTPRGRNHGYKLVTRAEQNPDWFAQVLTVDDTKKWVEEAKVPVITRKQITEEAETSGFDEDTIQQEYWCSFNASLKGAYYAKNMDKTLKEGKLCNVPYDPVLPVHTWWDLGIADAMAVWFVQMFRKEIRLIDYREWVGKSMHSVIRELQREEYVYGTHLAPHDIKVRSLETGKTRLQFAEELGFRFTLVPKIPIIDGINASRALLNRCWFDSLKTERGVDCLRNYKKDWDQKLMIFRDKPKHDEFSNGADAFRTGAVGLNMIKNKHHGDVVRPTHARTDYNPRNTSGTNRPRFAKRQYDVYNPR